MYQLNTHYKKIVADTITPVSIYLKIRDRHPNSILLESSDYHTNDNSFSYVCSNPIAFFKVENNLITQQFPDGIRSIKETKDSDVTTEIHNFTQQFKADTKEQFKFINNGVFGYTAYDAVKYFEDIDISKKENSLNIPDIYYAVYQNIIAIVHFKNEAYIFAHCFEDTENNISSLSNNKSFTVTTGHQLCLCSGPLYCIYKILSVINLSEKLKEKYPSYHFCLCFGWLQKTMILKR